VAPGFFGATLVLLFVNLVNAVPATPGQIGLFEAGAAAACVVAGATPEQGIAVGVLYHMMQLIPETVLGALVLAETLSDVASCARWRRPFRPALLRSSSPPFVREWVTVCLPDSVQDRNGRQPVVRSNP